MCAGTIHSSIPVSLSTHDDLATTDRGPFLGSGRSGSWILTSEPSQRVADVVEIVQRLSRLTEASSCYSQFKHGMNGILTDSVLCGTEATLLVRSQYSHNQHASFRLSPPNSAFAAENVSMSIHLTHSKILI